MHSAYWQELERMSDYLGSVQGWRKISLVLDGKMGRCRSGELFIFLISEWPGHGQGSSMTQSSDLRIKISSRLDVARQKQGSGK